MISTAGRKSQRIERSEDMGKKLGKFVVKNKILILIVSVLLLIPSAIGYIHTKVNYDILTYLPDTIETMKGQDILKEEFGTGAFSMYIVEGMPDKDVQKLEDQIKEVPGVKNVIWYSDVMDISIPKEMLPDDIYEAFNNGDATMMFILFDDTTSADETIEAVREIRKLHERSAWGYAGSGRERSTDLCHAGSALMLHLADAVDGQLPGSVPVPGIDRHGHRVQPRHKPDTWQHLLYH